MTTERKKKDRAAILGGGSAGIPDSATGPTKRRFWVRIDALVEIDDRLLEGVLTDEWRQDYYRLLTASDVATHLGYNLIQGSRLSSLDGFADQPEDRATLLEIDVDDWADEVPACEGQKIAPAETTKKTTKERGKTKRVPRTRATPRRKQP